jgi:branched-chain amino acid transport system permease protein
MTIDTLAGITISAVVLGSLYALMASGLSLVWGSLRMFNFSYGTLIMIGAYIAWAVSNHNALGLGLPAGIVVSLLAVAGIGLIEYWILVRPFVGRRNADLTVIIATIAAATIIQNGAVVIWGPRFKQVDPFVEGSFTLLGTGLSYHQALEVLIGPTLLLAFAIFLKRSRVGKAVRSVEQNLDSARLLGVDPNRIYAFVFALSAAWAALAGIMLGATAYMTPDFGSDPLLKAFMVVILGGLGSLPGTVMAAYLIGALEAVLVYFVGLYWTPVVLFGVIIGFMVVRPTGLYGART